MSLQTKKRFKNLGKIIGVVLFAFLMFTNIKIALMDDAELASGDISVLGIELNLFEGTYAGNEGQYLACTAIGCSYLGSEFCGYATTLNGDGTTTTYWCVIYVVHGGCDPPQYC